MINRPGPIQKILGPIIILLLLAGCTIPKTMPTPTSTVTQTPTLTPTMNPCTGWTCIVKGVVYAETSQPGNELEGATVILYQHSYCSPTMGEHQTTTDSNGRFEFSDIFLHDTDQISIRVRHEGYETATWRSETHQCLSCSCFTPSLEFVLHTHPSP